MQITSRCSRFVLCINQRRVLYRSNHSNCSNLTGVRVRFAPSPTGNLHLGGLRTALYNYLFAKANNGKFIVRIEDTDQTRLVRGATENIFKDLEWAGIIPDESVFHGGNHGPYVQSERLPIYSEEVKKLLQNGSAYHCFCTERRLELVRKQAIKLQQKPGYDNKCRHLTAEQVAEKLANKVSSCVRLKLNADINGLDDIIYGHVEYDLSEHDSDPIIMKSDGYPTYHFANVVDDHFMDVTHVLRGVEWQVSTPKHIQLYRAFGWTPPQFAHMPLLVNSDGRKLSKRQQDINIEYYRSKGIFPRALINFMIQTGGGFVEKDNSENNMYSLLDLQKMFDIALINKHSGRLAFEKLNECNRLELNEHIEDPVECEKLIERVSALVTQHYSKENANIVTDKEHIRHILHWAMGQRIHSLEQLIEGDLSFLWVLSDTKAIKNDIPDDTLDALTAVLASAVYENNQLLAVLKDFATEHNLKFGKLMQSLRLRLSGVPTGPKIGEMMEILGPKITVQRIRRGMGSNGSPQTEDIKKIEIV